MNTKKDNLRPEYGEAELSEPLANGIRGEYVERYRQETDLVMLPCMATESKEATP